LISAGISHVSVFHSPAVGILSIGDELREFKQGERISNFETNRQIMINNFFNLISGFLKELGIHARLIGICKDDANEIRRSIESHIDEYDSILTIGGSSVGEKDYTPNAILSAEGSKMVFHGVRMVPIKPAGLFLVKNKPVVIVPSHASSAVFTFFLIALPVLNIISGLEFGDRKLRLDAICEEPIENTRPIDAIALVRLVRKDGIYRAMHLGWHSNVISNLSLANGFVVMSHNKTIQKSEHVEVELLGTSQLARITQS
ncbi:MAG: molybdopterin-binding protein, partial [Nitrososphaerales archaeon]